jgi:hypothetical protein
VGRYAIEESLLHGYSSDSTERVSEASTPGWSFTVKGKLPS